MFVISFDHDGAQYDVFSLAGLFEHKVSAHVPKKIVGLSMFLPMVQQRTVIGIEN